MSILESIQQYGILSSLSGAVGVSCVGSKFHSPTPLCTFAVSLRDLFADERQDEFDPNSVWLCGICRENLRVFLLLMIASNGGLPWETKRRFGNQIRSLGMKAWTEHYEESQRA